MARCWYCQTWEHPCSICSPEDDKAKIAELEAEIERLNIVAFELDKIVAATDNRAEKAESERAECVAMLRGLRYRYHNDRMPRTCNCCGNAEGSVYRCELDDLFAKLEGGE